MNTNDSEKREVCLAIHEQLGFWSRAEFGVTTRTMLTDKRGGIELLLGGAPDTAGKRVRIVLTESDTYEVEVFKVGRKGSKAWGQKVDLKTATDVYASSLAATVGTLIFGKPFTPKN